MLASDKPSSPLLKTLALVEKALLHLVLITRHSDQISTMQVKYNEH